MGCSVRLDGAEAVTRDRGNKQPVGGPTRTVVAAKQATRAVGLNHPWTLPRFDEQMAAAGQAGQRGRRVGDPGVEDVADPVAHGGAGGGEEQRAVVVLRYLLEYTPGEISRMLGLPRGTVNSRLRRGLDRLRDLIEVEA